MINLDHIESVARAAREFLNEAPVMSWEDVVSDRPPSEDPVSAHKRTCSPDVVLALVARVRELQAGLKEACDLGCAQMSHEDYRRMGELEDLAK